MKLHARLLVAASALLSACGAVTQIPEAQPAAVHATAASTTSPTLTPGAYLGTPPPGHPVGRLHIDLSLPNIAQSVTCGDYPGNYQPPSISQQLADPSVHAAAVVTITAVNTPIYNTPDGQRWTQAWYDAGHDLDIYTPYVVTIDRALTSGVTAGQGLTIYAEGGQMPNHDWIEKSCYLPTVQHPQPGWQAVVGISGPIPGLSTGPTVAVFDVVRDGKVVMPPPGTPQPIP